MWVFIILNLQMRMYTHKQTFVISSNYQNLTKVNSKLHFLFIQEYKLFLSLCDLNSMLVYQLLEATTKLALSFRKWIKVRQNQA